MSGPEADESRQQVEVTVDAGMLIKGAALQKGLSMEGVEVLDAKLDENDHLYLELEGNQQ